MPKSLSRRVGDTSPATVQIFTTALLHGPISRIDLARRTGLSAAAVTKSVGPLMEAGYLTEVEGEGPRQSGLGRPARPLGVAADREFFVGVKVTLTRLFGVVTDLHARVRAVRQVPVFDVRPEAVVSAIAALVDELLDLDPRFRARTLCLGLAAGGHIDRVNGVVRDSDFLGWRDVALGAPVARSTGLGVVVENDIRSLTAVEQWFGHGRSAHSFALVTLGDGIGAGIVADGRLLTGAYGVAGELGHIPIEPDGARCRCGARGCLETIASQGAILSDVRAALGDWSLSLEGAVARASEAAPVLRRAGRMIGCALATVANLTGTERIVLAGNNLAFYPLIRDDVFESYAEHLCGPAASSVIVEKELPYEEWARGAAAVAIGDLFGAHH